MHVHVCLSSYVCGGQGSASDVIPLGPSIVCFEIRSLTGIGSQSIRIGWLDRTVQGSSSLFFIILTS